MTAKRDQLLDTAERLFYVEGFFATGIDRVIAEAGVARMTLYKHFPSKDDLVLAVLERRDAAYWRCLDAAVQDARAAGRPPVRAMLDAHGRWLAERSQRGCIFLKALGEYGAHSTAIADAAHRHKQAGLRFVADLLAAEGLADAEGRARRIVMLMEGATATVQILTPEVVAEQLRAAAEALLPDEPSNATPNAEEVRP